MASPRRRFGSKSGAFSRFSADGGQNFLIMSFSPDYVITGAFEIAMTLGLKLAEIVFIFLTMFVFLHFQTAVVHHLDVSERDDLWINAQVLIRAKMTQKSSVLPLMNSSMCS